MPVRSLSLSVMKWPDARAVDEAVRLWAVEIAQGRSDVLKVGYFGSYSRGDWGVGSDVDLLVIVNKADLPFERRPVQWDTTGLPVPADLLVYTQDEWTSLTGRFRDALEREAVWVLDRV